MEQGTSKGLIAVQFYAAMRDVSTVTVYPWLDCLLCGLGQLLDLFVPLFHL